MVVTPAKTPSLQISNARTLLSNSTTFQTWVGAASAAAALSRIHMVTGGDGAPTRPYAVVSWAADAYSATAVSGGYGHTYEESGAVEVLFENSVGSGNSADSDAAFEHMNAVGGIVADLAAIAGSGSYLNVKRFSLSAGPARSRDSQGEGTDYVQSVWRLEWGA